MLNRNLPVKGDLVAIPWTNPRACYGFSTRSDSYNQIALSCFYVESAVDSEYISFHICVLMNKPSAASLPTFIYLYFTSSAKPRSEQLEYCLHS